MTIHLHQAFRTPSEGTVACDPSLGSSPRPQTTEVTSKGHDTGRGHVSRCEPFECSDAWSVDGRINELVMLKPKLAASQRLSGNRYKSTGRQRKRKKKATVIYCTGKLAVSGIYSQVFECVNI